MLLLITKAVVMRLVATLGNIKISKWLMYPIQVGGLDVML